MGKFIPLSVPNLKGNELKYITEAVQDEWVSTGGAYINKFEDMVAEYVDAKGAVACQSGTAGLHLSLIVNGISEGDEVIVPALTFIAAVNPVKYVGAEPVFMDCDDTLCMDMNKVAEFCDKECIFDGERLINRMSGRHIKAIIVVHVFGNMADMEKALELSELYNLTIIEDATEALGSYVKSGRLKGKFAGTIGHIGVYSFNGNKIITTGGGGMIVSNNENLLKKAKYLSTQSKDDALYYIHNEIGYNYRMTNLQAAIGIGQMEQLEPFIEIKKENYNAYIEYGIDLLPFREDIRSNHWFYSIRTKKRDDLIKHLNDEGIQSRPIWNLICELNPYKDAYKYKIEKAIEYWDEVVNIPCSTNLTSEEIEKVAEKIKIFG